MRQHLIIADADHTDALPGEVLSPLLIIGPSFLSEVTPAVEFDCQLKMFAIKIENERLHWMLTPELVAPEAAIAQRLP